MRPNSMSKVTKAISWLSDVLQVLVLYRFSPDRRKISEQASTACRSLKFHATAKIRQQDLRELLPLLQGEKVDQVLMPGPNTDFGDVGSQTGYHALASLVQAIRPKTILEIGTYLGVSAYTFALNAPADCRVFTVDLPDGTSAETIPELNAIDQHHVATSQYRVGEAFLRSPLRERIVQIREDSMTFRAEKVVDQADFVYIDGGHSSPVLTKDTENALRVLSPRGVIVWDDYFHLYSDVVHYLDTMADRYPLRGIRGTNYVIYSRSWSSQPF